MADISAIKLPNGTTYNLKDTTARNAANSAVPNTRTVNGKALSSNISLGAGDVGAYTKSETDTKINAAIASAYKYKGSVTADKLPTSGQVVGDVYNITNDSSYGKAGMNVAWTGTTWDALGSNVDLSNYVTTSDSRLSNARPASDVYAWAKAAKKPSYSASEINGLGSLATKNGLSAGDVGALPTSGGTMTGDIAFAATGTTGTSNKISFSGSTDGAQIYYNVPSSDQGNLIFNMTDDTNAYIQFAQNGTVHSYISPADGTYHGNISGSAGSVAWGNVSDKPSTYPPSSHTHTKAQVGLGNVANLDQSKAIKSITRSGTTFTATALDGTTTTFTQQDTNTTYGIATASADGLMSKTDKAKLDGMDPSAITTNAANIKKNADAISAETTRAKAAEKANADAISAEVTRAKAAEKANADTISKLNSPENPSLLGSEDDLNNVLTGGFYHIDNGYNPANMPEGNDNAALLVMQGRSHTDIVQILISGNSDNIIYRTGNMLNKYWTDWRKIANTVDVNTINAAIQGVKDSKTNYVNCGVITAADMDAFVLKCAPLIKAAFPYDSCGFTSGMFQAVHEGDDYYYGLWYILSATEVDLVFFKQRADTIIKCKVTGDSIAAKYVYQNMSTLSARVDALASDVAVRASLIPTGKAIYAGDDLNNISYTAVGTYYCSAIAEAQHISNLPEVTAFMMTVYNPLGLLTGPLSTPWQYRVQEFMPYYGTQKYIRMVSTDGESNVTWGDWVKMTNSNDLGAVSNTINTHIANKANPHAVTKAQVGLGNVDNTADSAKSVKYATSAGSANSVAWGNVSGRPSSLPANGGNSSTVNGHTVNADVPSGAKFTDTTYSAATQSANGLMSAADKKKLDSYTTGSAGGAVEVTLAAASWSSSTTEINGNNYYTYSVSVANIGNPHPQIFCSGGNSIIPSAIQESEFNNIRYALVDTAKSTVTFYSIEKPSVAINVVIKDYLESSIVSGTASVTIATSDWSSTTSTVNGRAFYTAKKTLSSVSSNYPTIICGTADTLPSDAEQTAFDCINYAAADTSTKTVTFYAIQKPTSTVVAIVI